MILGMSTSTFTLVHVILSLIGIFAGLLVLAGMFGSKKLDGWTALFLATTVLTSVTGFFFPADKLLPSHIVGIVSLVVLAATLSRSMGIASRDPGAGSTSWARCWRSISTSSSGSCRRSRSCRS